MTVSRKSRIKIILSAIWFALVLFAALGMADSYSSFQFAFFIEILTVFAVLPLLILWGIAWIRVAPKEREVKQPKVPSETPSVKKGKWYTDKGIFTVGVLAVIVAQVAELAFPASLEAQTRGYTVGAYVGISLVKILSYSVILAIVSAVVGLLKPKAIKFKIFAWLFLSAGIFDLGATAFCVYTQQEVFHLLARRPDIFDRIVKESGYQHWQPPDTPIEWTPPDTAFISIEGIGISPDNRLHAIINGRLAYERSVVNGYKVRRIYTDKVEFEKDGQVFVQKMN